MQRINLSLRQTGDAARRHANDANVRDRPVQIPTRSAQQVLAVSGCDLAALREHLVELGAKAANGNPGRGTRGGRRAAAGMDPSQRAALRPRGGLGEHRDPTPDGCDRGAGGCRGRGAIERRAFPREARLAVPREAVLAVP